MFLKREADFSNIFIEKKPRNIYFFLLILSFLLGSFSTGYTTSDLLEEFDEQNGFASCSAEFQNFLSKFPVYEGSPPKLFITKDPHDKKTVNLFYIDLEDTGTLYKLPNWIYKGHRIPTYFYELKADPLLFKRLKQPDFQDFFKTQAIGYAPSPITLIKLKRGYHWLIPGCLQK